MPQNTPVIRYQEFDGTDGLALSDNVLTAYAQGKLVATATAGADTNLRELMLDYDIPTLLPELTFCHTEPQTVALTVTLNPWSLPDEISGVVTLDGAEHFWVATRLTHPDFRRRGEVPAGQRPWAQDTDETGWEFLLPVPLQTHPDHILPKRVALALEAFVEDVRSGRDLPVPYRREVTNLFSAAAPAWRVNLPRIASLGERADSGRV